MVAQLVLDQVVDLILEFTRGVSNLSLIETVDKVCHILRPNVAITSSERGLIDNIILAYRKGGPLLEESVNKINDVLNKNSTVTVDKSKSSINASGIDLSNKQPNSSINNNTPYSNSSSSNNNSWSISTSGNLQISNPTYTIGTTGNTLNMCCRTITAIQEKALQKKFVENKTDLMNIIETIVEKDLIKKVDCDNNQARFYHWYNVEIQDPSSSTPKLLFDYYENRSKAFSPNEIILGFLAEFQSDLGRYSNLITLDPFEMRIKKR